MLKPLPPTESKFWDNADKHSVDVTELKDLLCKKHVFDVFVDKRVIQCQNCSFGGKFTPSGVSIDGDKIILNNKEYLLGQIYGGKSNPERQQ